MVASLIARTLGRGRRPATGAALAGTAAALAASLAIGSAPVAEAAPRDIPQQVMLAGPLVGLLPVFGIDSVGPIPIPPVTGILPDGGNLTLNFTPIAYDTQTIYNTVNAMPFQRRRGLFGIEQSILDRVYATSGPAAGQFPAILSSGIGTLNSIKALRNQISSVNGVTPGGFTPYQPGPGGIPNTTNQELLWLRNPLRPNGGLMTRFAPVLNLFGVDTSIPAAGVNTGAGGAISLNTGQVDISWAYDPISDFPVTLNPFALANSMLAGLPTNLVGGISPVITTQDGTRLEGNPLILDFGLNVAGVLGIANSIVNGFGVPDGKRYYITLSPDDLPILEPLRLPARLINAITGLDLGTPIADALQPAMKILVNTGYTDVITPDRLNTCAVQCEPGGTPQTYADLGYTAYDRSYGQSDVSTAFLSTSPLTFQEWAAVPGDVVNALVQGFADVFIPKASPPVPTPAATTAPVAAVAAASATRAAKPAPGAAIRPARAAAVSAPDPGGSAGPVAAPARKASDAEKTPKVKRAGTRSAN